MNNKHYAYLSKIFFKNSNIIYALRYESISFKNTFSGTSASFISKDANLVTNGFEPSRAYFSISKEVESFIFRAESILEKTSSDDFKRFSASLIWQDTLWMQ
jgi:hypothetical protein